MIKTVINRVKTMSSAKSIYRKLLEYHKNLVPEDIEIDRALSDMYYEVRVNCDKVDIFGHIKV